MITLSADGSQLTYAANGHPQSTGNEAIQLTVKDIYGATDGTSHTVANLTVAPNSPIVPSTADSYTLNHNLLPLSTPLTVNAGNGVLANVIDPGATLTAKLLTGPSHGSLTLNTDGSFKYTPNLLYLVGDDTFTFKAYNGTSYSALETVVIHVDLNPVLPMTYLQGQKGPTTVGALDAATIGLDNPNFHTATGVLTVALKSGAAAGDVLSISTDSLLKITGNNLYFNKVLIGSFTGGTNLTPLIVTFNGSANTLAVLDVINNVGYANTTMHPSTANRVLSFIMTDSTFNTLNEVDVNLNFFVGYIPPQSQVLGVKLVEMFLTSWLHCGLYTKRTFGILLKAFYFLHAYNAHGVDNVDCLFHPLGRFRPLRHLSFFTGSSFF